MTASLMTGVATLIENIMLNEKIYFVRTHFKRGPLQLTGENVIRQFTFIEKRFIFIAYKCGEIKLDVTINNNF